MEWGDTHLLEDGELLGGTLLLVVGTDIKLSEPILSDVIVFSKIVPDRVVCVTTVIKLGSVGMSFLGRLVTS